MTTSSGWRQMLTAVPTPNVSAHITHGLSGQVTVTVKKTRPGFMVPPLSWIVPCNAERCVTLDALGAEVWGRCDGKRSVEAIVDDFAAAHRLTFHESRVAVTGYLKKLIERGVLAILLPENDE
ncbi:MAG: PqqD family protein [Lentisphaerae bacterium]|nr:PqqD family protein [Lentisphaerota bacterium]